MSVEFSEQEQWIEKNRTYFDTANNIASSIEDQNNLYTELVESGSITVKPLESAAVEYLTAEQIKSMRELGEAEQLAPYEELVEREQQLQCSINKVTEQLQSRIDQENSPAALVRQEAEYIATRIPNLSEKLSKIAFELEQELVAQERNALEAQRTALIADHDAVMTLYETAGTAWPIPKLATAPLTGNTVPEAPLETVEHPDNPVKIIEIDDFPDTPHTTKEQLVERIHRNYPSEILRDASEFLALLLAEEPKTVFTLDELGDIIYGDDESSRNSRVSALVSNFTLQKTLIIGDSLSALGLAFQRGTRRSYDAQTGTTIGRGHPVFRAVPLTEAGNTDRIIYSESKVGWADDGWHTLCYESDARPDINDYYSASDAHDDDVDPIETIPTSVFSASEPQPELSQEVTHEPDFPVIPTQVSVHREEAPKEAVETSRHPEWLENLQGDIITTIKQFEQDGLMESKDISWTAARVKSSSRIIGTETMARRGLQNRIISKADMSPTSVIPVASLICMALQNSHPDIFSTRTRRKQAVALVEQIVAEYFERVS